MLTPADVTQIRERNKRGAVLSYGDCERLLALLDAIAGTAAEVHAELHAKCTPETIDCAARFLYRLAKFAHAPRDLHAAFAEIDRLREKARIDGSEYAKQILERDAVIANLQAQLAEFAPAPAPEGSCSE